MHGGINSDRRSPGAAHEAVSCLHAGRKRACSNKPVLDARPLAVSAGGGGPRGQPAGAALPACTVGCGGVMGGATRWGAALAFHPPPATLPPTHVRQSPPL